MSSHLSDGDIAVVVGMLDGWVGDLQWSKLVNAIQIRLGTRYSRQALDRHWQIKSAFQTAKNRLGSRQAARASTGTVEVIALNQRIARLEAEVDRLERENNAYVEQFHVWAYNAHCRGLTQAQLDRPLPGIDRAKPRA